MKLSGKLFIGLLILLTGIIVWQVVISNQVMKDIRNIIVHSKEGEFSFIGNKSGSLFADIHLDNSKLDFNAKDEVHINKINLTGTMAESGMWNVINTSAECDSLLIHLSGKGRNSVLKLEKIKGMYEDIVCSENIEVTRSE